MEDVAAPVLLHQLRFFFFYKKYISKIEAYLTLEKKKETILNCESEIRNSDLQ